MKEYEIWLGKNTFVSQGESFRKEPYFLGKENGNSFQEACLLFFYKSRVELIKTLMERNDTIIDIYNITCLGYNPSHNYLEREGRLFDTYEAALLDFK